MLKINKLGFHLYVIAQIWLFVMCNLVIKGAMTMNWVSIFTTILIIACYWLLMREALMIKQNSNQFSDYEEVKDEDDDDE